MFSEAALSLSSSNSLIVQGRFECGSGMVGVAGLFRDRAEESSGKIVSGWVLGPNSKVSISTEEGRFSTMWTLCALRSRSSSVSI